MLLYSYHSKWLSQCLFSCSYGPVCSSTGSSLTTTSNELPLALLWLSNALLLYSKQPVLFSLLASFHHPHPRFSDMYLHIPSSRFLSRVGKIKFCCPSKLTAGVLALLKMLFNSFFFSLYYCLSISILSSPMHFQVRNLSGKESFICVHHNEVLANDWNSQISDSVFINISKFLLSIATYMVFNKINWVTPKLLIIRHFFVLL